MLPVRQMNSILNRNKDFWTFDIPEDSILLESDTVSMGITFKKTLMFRDFFSLPPNSLSMTYEAHTASKPVQRA
jgi:hypothetical protein